MSYDPHQFRDLTERTLQEIGMYSVPATQLLMGTAAQESGLGTYLRQITGPALGAFQIEPFTFDWLCLKYSSRYPELAKRYSEELEWDLRLGIIMCRMKYYSCPGIIPGNLVSQAHYWKKHYNTYLGSGKVEEYIANYKKYVDRSVVCA